MSTQRNTPASVWRRIERRGADECWPFIGAVNTHGYGQIRVNGKHELAHRLAFELATGIGPGHLLVCHKCDNRRCCNPSHLFVGTSGDNARDAAAKGRLPGTPKLTVDDVREIRALARAGTSYAAIAPRFGVTPENISLVALGLTWRHAA